VPNTSTALRGMFRSIVRAGSARDCADSSLLTSDRLLACVESLDNGKSIRETRDSDVPLVARHFYHHAGWAQLMPDEMPGWKPLGVIGEIVPWNFPIMLLAWKVCVGERRARV
jgi:acyl-CoA reductase-like NAD-dependent aldehyde dehydrogenase